MKLFTTLGILVFICVIFLVVMIYYLSEYAERADAVIAKQKSANIFTELGQFNSVLGVINAAYLNGGNPAIKKTYDNWRAQYEEFAAYSRGEALEPRDAGRLNQMFIVRGRILTLETKIFLLIVEDKKAAAQTVFDGVEYRGFTRAFGAMLEEGKVAAEKEMATYTLKRDTTLTDVVLLAYFFLFILILAGSALISIVSATIARAAWQVERAATEIGRGEVGKRIDVQSNDELGKMAVAFNKMAVALDERAREKLKEITKNIGQ